MAWRCHPCRARSRPTWGSVGPCPQSGHAEAHVWVPCTEGEAPASAASPCYGGRGGVSQGSHKTTANSAEGGEPARQPVSLWVLTRHLWAALHPPPAVPLTCAALILVPAGTVASFEDVHLSAVTSMAISSQNGSSSSSPLCRKAHTTYCGHVPPSRCGVATVFCLGPGESLLGQWPPGQQPSSCVPGQLHFPCRGV